MYEKENSREVSRWGSCTGRWGAEGCRENLDTILDWLMEEAQLRELPHGRFTRAIARSLVLTAIRRFERKYPDGPPEPADAEDP